jgi:hypothetical protein
VTSLQSRESRDHAVFLFLFEVVRSSYLRSIVTIQLVLVLASTQFPAILMDIDKEHALRAHIRKLLLRYSLTHLTINFVTYTRTKVSEVSRG